MRQRIGLGELMPDVPAFAHPGLIVADGVYPINGGYAPLGSFQGSANGTLAATCLGAASFRAADGTVFTIAGTAAQLYRYQASGWTSVGSGYSASAQIGWRFAQWGDLIIATNGVDLPRALDMTAGSPSFAALSGTPPIGELIAIVRDFVVLGRADNDPKRVQWSENDDAEGWTVGTNEADFQIMPTGGEVTALSGGEYGLVFQDRRISRMSYIGGDAIFQFDEISANIGCIAAGSLAKIGNLHFFLSHQGFAVCDGSGVRAIGDEKVNRTVLGEIDRSYLPQMSVAVDPRKSLVIWAIPNAATSTKLYIYNWALDRWSTATQTSQQVFSGLTESTTLEQLNSVYSSLDDMTVSLDDPQWKGGYPLISLIDGNQALGALSGTPKAATFTTGDLELVPGRRARVREVVPLVDTAANMTLTIAGRERLGDTLAEADYTTLNRRGAFKTRDAWRFVRLSLALAEGATWTAAVGLDAEYEAGGR